MGKLFRALRNVLGVLVVLVALLALASRFADGPIVELLPGGPFVSGDFVDPLPTHWGFVGEETIVEIESDGRSRKTWILTLDGQAYVPASLGFPPFKSWHEKALEEPAGVLRIAGKRYAVQLTKIDDPALETRLAEQVKSKYGGPPTQGAGTWFFRLDPAS